MNMDNWASMAGRARLAHQFSSINHHSWNASPSIGQPNNLSDLTESLSSLCVRHVSCYYLLARGGGGGWNFSSCERPPSIRPRQLPRMMMRLMTTVGSVWMMRNLLIGPQQQLTKLVGSWLRLTMKLKDCLVSSA